MSATTLILTVLTIAALGAVVGGVLTSVRRLRRDGYMLSWRDARQAAAAMVYAAGPVAAGIGISELIKGSYVCAAVWMVPGVALFVWAVRVTKPWARWLR
jgi:uncharacterized protein involved in response to NO